MGLDVRHNEHFVKMVFIPYFTDIFKDLSQRAKTGKERPNDHGINKLTFLQFANLPGIFGDRLFQLCCDKDQKQVNLPEFRKIMQRIFYSRMETKLGLIFEFYDFNNDGYVTDEDIRLVLSHLPLAVPKPSYEDRITSQWQLHAYIKDLMHFMGGKKQYNLA